MKKVFAPLSLVLCLLLCLCACTPAAAPTPTPAVPTAPAGTAAPTAAPTQDPNLAPDATPLPEGDPLGYDDLLLDVASYLPAANMIVTQKNYVGSAQAELVSTVYAAYADHSDETYRVSGFPADQPSFYTDYYVDQAGLWAEFADDPQTGKYLLLPAQIAVGQLYNLRGEEAEITQVGASVQLDGFSAEGCIVVQVASSAYLTDVTYVFAPNMGLVAQYIDYGDDVMDIISCVDVVSAVSEAEAQNTVAASMR